MVVGQVHDLDGRFGSYGFDFSGTLWEPAKDVASGISPYPEPTAASLAVGNPSVYPPLPIVAIVPLAGLDFDAAYGVWALALALAVLGALRLVGVRDWRCHALALLSPPVVEGLFLGNIALLLLLPLAAAWRWRANAGRVGIALAAAVAVKPFLVLVVVWLVLTRRLRAALVAIGATAVLLLGPWAAIGFDGLREYPDLLRGLEGVFGPGTVSVPGALSFVLAGTVAHRAACALAAVAFVAVAWRLRHGADGDLRVFATMVCASVVASPLAWPHYLALLFVPLGIARPRLSGAWFLAFLLPSALAVDNPAPRAWLVLLLALALAFGPLAARARERLA